jgi:hypothetical protein
MPFTRAQILEPEVTAARRSKRLLRVQGRFAALSVIRYFRLPFQFNSRDPVEIKRDILYPPCQELF